MERFNKRQIFYRRDSKEKPPEEEFVFDINNVDFRDERTIEYLDDLKENNLGKYYQTLEELADLEFLNRPEDYLNKELEEANEDYYKKAEYAKKAGFLKQEDVEKIEIDSKGVARYLGLTVEELKDLDKEDRRY